MPDLTKQLTEHLGAFSAAPYLFIGSGFSRRYLGSDTWAALLERFAAACPRHFDYYRSARNSNWPAVASLIASDFHETWFSSPAFGDSRTRYAGKASRISDPLKIEISEYLKSLAPVYPHEELLAAEVEAIQDAEIDGIITTNYDCLLESLFPTYRVFIGQDSTLFAPLTGIAEIYKIHGCVTEPSSLVLCDDDYKDFQERNSYLAAKLLTMFVEHPVIFLGYSLGDPYLRSIIHSIAACLRQQNYKELQGRLVFVQWDENAKGEMSETSIVFDDGPIPVVLIRANAFLRCAVSNGSFLPSCCASLRSTFTNLSSLMTP